MGVLRHYYTIDGVDHTAVDVAGQYLQATRKTHRGSDGGNRDLATPRLSVTRRTLSFRSLAI